MANLCEAVPVLALGPDVAHVYFVLLDEAHDPALLDAYHALMSPDEAAQHARFHRPRNQHEYLVTRALVRTVLSRYAPIDPRDWAFVREPHGRPVISGPAGAPPLRFNLTNTQGMVACVVAFDRDVGIDAESLDRPTQGMDIAERFFAAPERNSLMTLSDAERSTRFFDIWTLKESYIKARGLGLALPLDGFWFTVQGDDRIEIAFAASIEDQPAAWQFAIHRVSPVHVLATAVHKKGDAPLRVQVRKVVPLHD